VASGAAINTTAGVGGRAAESAALKGYKQGDEIKAFNAQDIAVDAVVGSIFGGVSRLGMEVSHDQYDAALALKNAKSFNIDAMPGTPESVGDLARHAKIMDTALDDILNERAVSVDAESAAVTFTPREDVGANQSHADIVKSVFDEEGYGRVYDEMTQAEAKAAEIDRSQSQFAPEAVPDVIEPSAFKDIQSESFRDLLPGDRVTASRDLAGLRAGEEAHVQSVDDKGSVNFSGADGQTFSVPKSAASDALDVSLNIRRPEVEDKPVRNTAGS